MKISSKVGLIVIIVVIVGVLIGLYTAVYSRQVAERNELNERLEWAQTLQTQLTASKSDLEDQMASAQSSLYASQGQYPASIESIEYGEHIFELIEKCNLQLASLSFPRPAGSAVGSVTYSVVPLSLPGQWYTGEHIQVHRPHKDGSQVCQHAGELGEFERR